MWFCAWPLTREEIRIQMDKRRVLGKFLYGLSLLDLKEDREEWENYLKSGKTDKKLSI